ncbi:hypothetical protein B9M90_25310 [Escherichia coli]|nr:hypothetical protein B9M90_25310 [Escherichia coli]RBW31172.1 hypothetical protein B9M91_23945 [Escherichia coli]
MMFWNRNKKDKATIANEKKRFNHLLSVAEKLPVKALPDLIRAIVRPVQSDFLLAVGKRLVRTVLIFTESSDQLSRATDRVPGLPASPGYVQ